MEFLINNQEELGRILKVVRKSYRFTAADVGDAVGISQSQISRIEQGSVKLYDQLFNILDTLGLEMTLKEKEDDNES